MKNLCTRSHCGSIELILESVALSPVAVVQVDQSVRFSAVENGMANIACKWFSCGLPTQSTPPLHLALLRASFDTQLSSK